MRVFELPELQAQEFPELEFLIGFLHYNGLGVPPNREAAFASFLAAAEAGLPSAQYAVGRMLHGHSQSAAAQWYEKAAKQGHRLAAQGLAHIHESWASEGRGDYSTVIAWLTRAAELGCATSSAQLGQIFDDGIHVSRDPQRALLWFQKACAQGEATACELLACAYEDGGLPVTIDPSMAAELRARADVLRAKSARDESDRVLRAAKCGDRTSMEMVVEGFRRGYYGLPVDLERAASWEDALRVRDSEPGTRSNPDQSGDSDR